MKSKGKITNHKGHDAIIVLCLAIAMAFFSLSAMAENDNKEPIITLTKKEVKKLSEQEAQERVLFLEQRLKEISQIEKQELNREKRKSLRKEVKDIRQELKIHNGIGIYIGGGTLLIAIILLLILL